MKDVEKPYYAILIDEIEHQGIGGKKIRIEKEGTIAFLLDKNLTKFTIGETNFINRRFDLITNDKDDVKIYYGHIGFLGYFIAEDEIKEVENEEI